MNLTHPECRDRSRMLAVHAYRVELDLSGAADPRVATYRSRTTITFDAQGDRTWVDLVASRVHAATLNGKPVPVTDYDGARLAIPGLAAHNQLVVEADCDYSRTGEGLHRFTDPQDDNTYLYTHLEPTDARRMFACFEQPDLKGTFTFVVTAPRQWQILSGQPEVSRTVTDELATVTFAPTPPQSTYITAVAAGPYHRVEGRWATRRADGTTQRVDIGLLCRQTMAPHLPSDELLEITRAGLDFFDEHFAYPYPWGKYDQIFVPEYNLGAMENPGLVTFTENYLIRGTATEHQREGRAEVVMHEMSHMWFGDLATPRWWDDLWLKESFADLMGYQVASEAAGFPGAWAAFALGRKQWAYTQDERPTTHPIVARIDDLEAARQNFDGITYSKGAAVLKQLQAYVGRDAFFGGARSYFAKHAFGSTTLDDLLDALGTASGQDLRPWARAWLQTTGPSVLTPAVARDDAGLITELTVHQEGQDAISGGEVLRPHRLQVGLYQLADGRLRRELLATVELTGERTRLPEAAGLRGDLVVVNDQDLTYAVCRLDPRSRQVAANHLSSLADPLTRAVVWSGLWNMVRHGEIPAGELLAALLRQAPAEPDAAMLQSMLGLGHRAVTAYLTGPAREDVARQLAVMADTRLRQAGPGTDAQLVWARYLARFAALSDVLCDRVDALLSGRDVPDGLQIDSDLRWALVVSLAAHGRCDRAGLDAELQLDPTMSGRQSHALALASLPGRTVKDGIWHELTSDPDLTNDRQRALLTGFAQPVSTADRAHLADAYFSSLRTWWRSMPQTMATRLVTGLFPPVETVPGVDAQQHPVIVAARTWLDENADAGASLRRTVTEATDDALRRLRVQAVAAR